MTRHWERGNGDGSGAGGQQVAERKGAVGMRKNSIAFSNQGQRIWLEWRTERAIFVSGGGARKKNEGGGAVVTYLQLLG